MKKKIILKYLLNLNYLQKKTILMELVQKSQDLTKEEKSKLIIKVDNMSNEEVNSNIRELVEFYG